LLGLSVELTVGDFDRVAKWPDLGQLLRNYLVRSGVKNTNRVGMNLNEWGAMRAIVPATVYSRRRLT